MEEKDLTPLQQMATNSPADFLAGVQSMFGNKVIEQIQLHASDALKACLAYDWMDEKQLKLALTTKFKWESCNQLIEEIKDAIRLATELINQGEKPKDAPLPEEEFDAYGYG